MKIRHNGITYDSLESLPPNVRNSLKLAFDEAAEVTRQKALKLQVQHEKKPVEIVRFDLNEFLNISDRLRSTRTFYIEG